MTQIRIKPHQKYLRNSLDVSLFCRHLFYTAFPWWLIFGFDLPGKIIQRFEKVVSISRNYLTELPQFCARFLLFIEWISADTLSDFICFIKCTWYKVGEGVILIWIKHDFQMLNWSIYKERTLVAVCCSAKLLCVSLLLTVEHLGFSGSFVLRQFPDNCANLQSMHVRVQFILTYQWIAESVSCLWGMARKLCSVLVFSVAKVKIIYTSKQVLFWM